MTKHIRRWLTNTRLREEFDGVYTGEIADVTLEIVHNKFRGRKVEEPVLRFTDGVFWIPPQRARRVLVDLLGAESDRWVGCRICVRLDRRGEKVVDEADPKARRVARGTFGGEEPRVFADYDDSPTALAAAGVGHAEDLDADEIFGRRRG
jgi:hypothetical protein